MPDQPAIPSQDPVPPQDPVPNDDVIPDPEFFYEEDNRGSQYLHAHRKKTTWDSQKLCDRLLILVAHSIFCHSAI